MRQVTQLTSPLGFLKKLQIYGYDHIEPFILHSLITGMPVLFIGPHGTGKTLLAERIAKMLGIKFHAYDASKALFEDIVGFPDIESMKKGKLEYIRGEITLWDKEFILIDEISRALPGVQNKWLEIIRSRRLMGVPLKQLKYIFSAMNPPSYAGAMPLDEALADRFAFIINLDKETDSYLDKILDVKTSEDAPLVFGKNGIEKDENFIQNLNLLKNIYMEALENSPEIKKFILIFSKMWKRKFPEFNISPRRWKMIYHNLIGVKIITGRWDEEIAINTILNSLPFHATSEEFTLDKENMVMEMVYNVFSISSSVENINEVSLHIDGEKSLNPFKIQSRKDVVNLIEKLLLLGEKWEIFSLKENWLTLNIIRNIVNDIQPMESFSAVAINVEKNLPLSPQINSLTTIVTKVVEKYDHSIDAEEIFEMIEEKILNRSVEERDED